MKLNRIVPILVVLTALSAGPLLAQASVTPADVQRLQDNIYDASRDVSQARSRDVALANQLQAELDDARDESIYLKVKLRKNEPIARSEYSDLRDKIENIRSRARGDAAGGYTAPAASASGSRGRPAPRLSTTKPTVGSMEIPAGTEFDVRLQKPLRDRKSTRLNSSHIQKSRMPSSA